LLYSGGRMDQEVSSLENLEFLEKLNLGWCCIRAESLCKILQKTRRMRDLNLRKSSLWDDVIPLHLDAITIQLRNSCPDLEIIDLSGNIITSRGIHALAECKKLRKLAMMEMEERCTIDKHSWRRLFSSCQCLQLEEVNLMNCDCDIYDVYEGLTLCKNLRQLYLSYGYISIVSQFSSSVLNCKQSMFHRRSTSICIMNISFAQAKEKYPHVSILEYQKGITYYDDDEEYEGCLLYTSRCAKEKYPHVSILEYQKGITYYDDDEEYEG
ncbi:hypothetical protein DBV15_11916, partial [Temnothorax longispinosus]